MRISAPSGSAARPREASRPGSAGSGFAVGAASSGPAQTAPTGFARPIAPLDTVLALQAFDRGDQRRQDSGRRGRRLLDLLDDIKLALLEGRVPEPALDRLIAAIGERIDSGDRALEAILDEIELRARVELAKLGRHVD